MTQRRVRPVRRLVVVVHCDGGYGRPMRQYHRAHLADAEKPLNPVSCCAPPWLLNRDSSASPNGDVVFGAQVLVTLMTAMHPSDGSAMTDLSVESSIPVRTRERMMYIDIEDGMSSARSRGAGSFLGAVMTSFMGRLCWLYMGFLESLTSNCVLRQEMSDEAAVRKLRVPRSSGERAAKLLMPMVLSLTRAIQRADAAS
ncbi:hypothetical protein OH76DRAFT_1423812 [Lentinus brumalis]|uniref:Uncharacterized protein n=1 Tax=Lentinus brumalis TaxID=2498619 RepID=A0A371CJ13_9APHY|nr:hypothetical protein OH76DRAFT_1423812 [Polyporus brumalis]